MKFHQSIILIFIAIISACNSGAEDKIIGSWKYDRIEMRPGSATQLDGLQQSLMSSVYSDVKYVFLPDGKCETQSSLIFGNTSTNYRLERDGRTITFLDQTGMTQSTITILKLTDRELWLDQGSDMAMVFVKE